jgi:hypothetical protein
MMDDTADDPIAFHLPELLGQHLLRNGRNGPLQFGEPHDAATKQVEQDHEFPSPIQEREGALYASRCFFLRVRSRFSIGHVPYPQVSTLLFRAFLPADHYNPILIPTQTFGRPRYAPSNRGLGN